MAISAQVKLFYVGGQRRTYLSRWKLVLSEYSVLHARLYNSSGLLCALYVGRSYICRNCFSDHTVVPGAETEATTRRGYCCSCWFG